MKLYAQCQDCGAFHPSALRGDGTICANCLAIQGGRPVAICSNCEGTLPFEMHHPDGRKNSNRTVVLCLNCHAIEHSRKWTKD